MSDLISRSALKKYMRDYKWEFAMNSDFSKAIEMVDCQPTAYDVDKVVEEIKDSYGACDNCKLYSMHECSAAHCQIKEIIDIVRRGGTDDGN